MYMHYMYGMIGKDVDKDGDYLGGLNFYLAVYTCTIVEVDKEKTQLL